LVLLHDTPQVIAKSKGVFHKASGLLYGFRIPLFLRGLGLLLPVTLITLYPIRQGPARFTDDGERKHMLGKLRFFVFQQALTTAGSIVGESFVVGLFHELIHSVKYKNRFARLGAGSSGAIKA